MAGGRLKGLVAVLNLADHLLWCFSAQQDSIKKANMKRENKAYSFKEQIIELELKEVGTWRPHTRGGLRRVSWVILTHGTLLRPPH